MNDEPVNLNLRRDVALPQRVVLPMALARRYDIDRDLTITRRQQQVPGGVAAWLRKDARYSVWEDLPEAVAEPVPEKAEKRAGEPTLGASGEDAPADGKPAAGADDKGGASSGTPEDDPPAVEPWSEAMTVPALREYAKAHEVALTAEDNKKEAIIKKLRDAELPEAKANEAGNRGG